MIQIKDIDKSNVFDVCELTTNSNGVGTVMEEYLCCNAVSIAESKYFLEMNPKAIYNDESLIVFLCINRPKIIKPKLSSTVLCWIISFNTKGWAMRL